ncbi:hypothetical protein HYPSUDRAFT_67935 [Hypholoma sublateritium FD-334 SS-4]|uniref:Transcription factor domain-containing protein n=1 Tax=Hypholoma sublateritium (strain FD-334 SS-4) TaxID=945553 RepID=A0A0D2NR17_HYPSF|nr:hypothetical protein HYPSUDRAFT_67935 [Hypholoma sublateritium FD-334 SS-4]
MEFDLNSESSLQKSKRVRLAGACDACRRRKSDSAQMDGERCSYCQTADIKCTHDIPPKQTKAELTAAYIRTLEEKVNKMYHLLQKIYPDQDIDRLLDTLTESADTTYNKSTPEPGDALTFSYPIPKTIPGEVNASEMLSTDTSEEISEEDLAEVALSKHLDHLRIKERYFGSASSLMFVKHCSDLKAEITGFKADGSKYKRPSFWYLRPWEVEYARAQEPRYLYPDEHLLHNLVALYFAKVNPFLPLLHRPTFFKMLLEKQHHRDVSFGTVVLMVCALGARYSQDPQVLSPGDTSGLSAGWQYFRQVPLHPDGFRVSPVLHDLQYYCLVHVYLLTSSACHVAWNVLGLAIQSAMARGVHRRRSAPQKPSKHEELMKRAFWCLIFLDRSSSAFSGRPCVIADEDFDLDYPIECDDEYWEADDPEQAFKQPSGQPCTITGFVHMLKLFVILAFAHRTLYSTKKTKVLSGLPFDDGWEQRTVAQLDSSMNQWKNSLPDSLQWDPERTDLVTFHQSVHLHTAYSYAQIQIHRPFLIKKSPLSFTSLAICTNAARSCAHVLEAGMTRGIKASPLLITSVLNAGLVISLNLWGSGRSGFIKDPTKQMEDFQTCVNFLKESEKRWHIGGRSVDLLAELNFSAKDYQESPRNKRRWDSSCTPMQSTTSGYPQSGISCANPRTAMSEPAGENVPNPGLNVLSGISDWDFLLLQMGHVQPNIGTPANQGELPTDFPQTSIHINPTTGLSDTVGQAEQVPEFLMTEGDLFSLWSDIPRAFNQDEWGVYLADVANSSCP